MHFERILPRAKANASGLPVLQTQSLSLHFSRVHGFPNENLRVSAGKLFCTACREEISLKRSTIAANHVASAKHKQSKVKLSKKESREKDVAEALVAYYVEQEHPRGETLSTDQRVYHGSVTAFLKLVYPWQS